MAAFNARLRQTVDLDAVRCDLLGVTETAFQPAHVSVWIAPPEPSSDPRPGREPSYPTVREMMPNG